MTADKGARNKNSGIWRAGNNAKMTSNVALVSGGVDSAVTLAEAQKRGETTAVWFDYDQHTASKERVCARDLTDEIGAELVEFDVKDVFHEFGAGLTDDTDLTQHYDEDGVASSYVPMRNTVFLSIAAGVAEDRGANTLWYGANLEDREGYADCRDEYAEVMDRALSLGTDRTDFSIQRPVIELEKPEIVERGVELGVPFEHTWSCYSTGESHCGECASCVERHKGFEQAEVEDPCT